MSRICATRLFGIADAERREIQSDADKACRIQPLQFRLRDTRRHDGDAARGCAQLDHGIARARIVEAVEARLHDHLPRHADLSAQRPQRGHRCLGRRVGAVRRHRIFRLRADDVDVAIDGAGGEGGDRRCTLRGLRQNAARERAHRQTTKAASCQCHVALPIAKLCGRIMLAGECCDRGEARPCQFLGVRSISHNQLIKREYLHYLGGRGLLERISGLRSSTDRAADVAGSRDARCRRRSSPLHMGPASLRVLRSFAPDHPTFATVRS